MTPSERPHRSTESPLECTHCQYPIPGDPVDGDGGDYFCSTACLEAAEGENTMPDPSAYKRIVTGVEPLDALLPNGVPADSFVRLAGEAGTRRDELLTELVWRALERGEPATVVTSTTPPTAVLERFFESGWNVLPALEDDRLRLVDCVTHRLADREAFLERRGKWNEFVGEAAADAIVSVESPDDRAAIRSALTETLDDLGMTGTGVVTIDSLGELERRFAADETDGDAALLEFLATVRATVCKARYVPIVAGSAPFRRVADAERSSALRAAGADSRFDGIVDLRLVERRDTETRRCHLGVRKLAGARRLPQWLAYEYEPARGLYALESTTERARSTGRDRRVEDVSNRH
ncbi:RAD55 family ATPase [Natronolimnohabitans innermongolicus]|uniref:Recombinase A n=1 Tax=Natronolimnohabitans innermongolicus JCM 12255 TaxID=1227499 RepID=L9WWD7_9EURY|nr:ATPase domain-containing protein [Natronolimnohabitans innermongolicus]ELY53814.1 recombinase A [Natronolimnohabitans innermongolicus JCM 12255]